MKIGHPIIDNITDITLENENKTFGDKIATTKITFISNGTPYIIYALEESIFSEETITINVKILDIFEQK